MKTPQVKLAARTERRCRAVLAALAAAALLAGAGATLAARTDVAGESWPASLSEDVVVKGCVERDAGSSTVVYKLVTSGVGGAKQYRLTASAGVEIGPHVGHTVEVTGAVTATRGPAKGGHEEPELVVRKLLMIATSC